MERKLASVQKILSLEPITGADAIEKATILGWQLVVKKGDFKPGDLCVYCEVDSILPERPEFEFLRARHFRIKTVRLRGQVSQGIAFPLTILPMPSILDVMDGDDVTELLGVVKYEIQVPAQLAGTVKGNFPGFLHKTDEMRIQAVPDVLARHTGKVFHITEKVDGSSMTVYLHEGTFGVCSRNLDLTETEGNAYWKLARELDLENKLKSLGGGEWCLQGELIGPGVQKNKLGLDKLHFAVFNVYNIATGEYLPAPEFVRVVNGLGLMTVPVLEIDHVLTEDIPALVALSIAPSVLNPKVQREGIIFRPLVEEFDKDLGRLSFKVINPEFLLKYND